MSRSNAYWERRQVALEERLLRKGDVFERDMRRAYDQASNNIQREINDFYVRFAGNNQMSMVEARRLLNNTELDTFRMDLSEYIEKGRTLNVSQRWARDLENASTRHRISRLESLQLKIQNEIEQVSAKYSTGANATMAAIFKEGFHRGIFEIGQRTGNHIALDSLDTRKIESALAQPWTVDETNFSQRIWTDRTKLNNYLKNELTAAFIRGDDPRKLTRKVRDRFSVSKNQAARLIKTESAYFASLSTCESYKSTRLEQFQILATLDMRTSDVCAALDGQVFNVSDYAVGVTAPPFHPNCRTTTIPYFDDLDEFSESQRAMRGDGGRTQFASDMPYAEWYNKYVVMPEADKRAKMDWISSKSYIVADNLRNGYHLSKDDRELVGDLDEALSRTSRYRGDISRSVEIRNSTLLNTFIQEHTAGNVVEYPSFTAFTRGETYNPGANIQIRVTNSTKGRDISDINAAELEILYERGARFIAKENDLIDGVYYILLEEE